MTTTPAKVKNVNVYPYLDGVLSSAMIPPIIEGATGVYSVGALGIKALFNLELMGGKHYASLVNHDKYIAKGEYENNKPFETTWMFAKKQHENQQGEWLFNECRM
jgi:hypothetical protein